MLSYSLLCDWLKGDSRTWMINSNLPTDAKIITSMQANDDGCYLFIESSSWSEAELYSVPDFLIIFYTQPLLKDAESF